MIKNIEYNRFMFNIEKYFFCKTEMVQLGFVVAQNDIWSVNITVKDILNMTPPKTKRQVCVFIGLVNYHRDMWSRWSNLLKLRTATIPDKVTFRWIDIDHKSFEEIKRMVARDALLAYPYFNKRFYIHADDSY